MPLPLPGSAPSVNPSQSTFPHLWVEPCSRRQWLVRFGSRAFCLFFFFFFFFNKSSRFSVAKTKEENMNIHKTTGIGKNSLTLIGGRGACLYSTWSSGGFTLWVIGSAVKLHDLFYNNNEVRISWMHVQYTILQFISLKTTTPLHHCTAPQETESMTDRFPPPMGQGDCASQPCG
ncbi:uncharacterized protein BO95DRAFT_11120 [Aspergillus brunneoviolaceus CBS 621.78]|uniref:Uncharacterized protein n=1 Tax=Aspergillus brunneoviolaceus CBS 621.78 TaxID=1450534 RepID=A0ACD1GJ81_9EURO|nr:hypothetical protein BO95DRAFT_11120 [Aspergillus brunneoviolaceus CBS 621.78]RAH49203.1 hypothetical protein BO95DRAFT_11120 [Aspergillus brunneoviolaceus CBS 621.78]